MPYFRMTPEAKQAIRNYAWDNLGGSHLPWAEDEDGEGKVWLDEEVVARLSGFSFPSESLSDTIIRILAMHEKGAN